MSQLIEQQGVVSEGQSGMRVDQVATALFADYSRARIQSWIKQAAIKVDGEVCRPKDKLFGGEVLTLSATLVEEDRWQPQAMDIDVIYKDEHIIIINKPAGLVVHPGAGVPDGTLLNGLLHHFPELSTIPRAGIVHRLDKETTGLMVVARSLLAQAHLVKQLQDRSLGREYEAIVMGELTGGGVIDKPIGRHPTQRVKMAVLEREARVWTGDGPKTQSTGKEAVTHYRLLQRFVGYTHIVCQLETGRTHQIRVHLSHINHPLVGDPVYLGRQKWMSGTVEPLKALLASFPRQALHAKRLSLVHPYSGDTMEWETELPEDMKGLLADLHQYALTSTLS